MRETGRSGTEAYLKKKVAAAGGETRKWVCPGRKNVPDQIVIWTRYYALTPRPEADIHFVETKAPGKEANPAQGREHNRLRALGCDVFVLDTKEKIDAYVEENR